MTAQIGKSKVPDEAGFRAAIEQLIEAKIAHLDDVGALPPSDPHGLERFIKRTPRGDPHPDLMEPDYEIVDDTYPEAI